MLLSGSFYRFSFEVIEKLRMENAIDNKRVKKTTRVVAELSKRNFRCFMALTCIACREWWQRKLTSTEAIMHTCRVRRIMTYARADKSLHHEDLPSSYINININNNNKRTTLFRLVPQNEQFFLFSGGGATHEDNMMMCVNLAKKACKWKLFFGSLSSHCLLKTFIFQFTVTSSSSFLLLLWTWRSEKLFPPFFSFLFWCHNAKSRKKEKCFLIFLFRAFYEFTTF